MSVVENAIDIDRTAEEVFDCCSDMRTAPASTGSMLHFARSAGGLERGV